MARTVVCGIDGSSESVAAAKAGVRLAAAVDARPILVNAIDETTAFPYGDGPARERGRRHALDAAQQLLSGVAIVGGEHAERRVVSGEPASAVAAVADETGAVAVCVGSRGRGPLQAALLGSTSRAVVRDSPCPTLVVPRAAANAATGSSIVCGLDGSPESENALRAAASLRRALDLRLVLVHVRAPDALLALAPGTGPPPLEHSERIDGIGMPIEADERVTAGEASGALDATAEDEDAALIIVGTHARGALKSAALGSVSSRLASSASRPVLLVRADAEVAFG